MISAAFKTAGTFSLVLLGAMICVTAEAEIYKWKDANGKVHFSDTKPEQAPAETVMLPDAPVRSASASAPPAFKPQFTPTVAPVTQKNVVLYSASWCGYCTQARNFFNANAIPFREYDVETSNKGKRDFKSLGGKAVPIILVDKQKLQGFNSAQFMKQYQMR